MAKDKRIKGCYNLECRRYRKEYKYETTDNFCTICGTPLVFVCVECFEKIEDNGPEHKLCDVCEAKHQARRDAVNQGVDKAKAVAAAGVKIVPEAIALAQKEPVKKLVKKGADIIIKKKL